MTIDTKYRAICFDMDGTLLNTKVDYGRMTGLIFDIFTELGVPSEIIDRGQGHKFNVEAGYAWLLQNGDKKKMKEIQSKLDNAAKAIEMENVELACLFPDTDDLLEKIKSKGFKVGVLTRGYREYAEKALKIAGIFDDIDAMVTMDDFPSSECKPSPLAMAHMAQALNITSEEILYVGDHTFDYLCAKNSGAGFIAVLSGTRTESEWKELSEDMVILPTVAGLKAML